MTRWTLLVRRLRDVLPAGLAVSAAMYGVHAVAKDAPHLLFGTALVAGLILAKVTAMARVRQFARASGMPVVAVSLGLREDLVYPILFAVVALLVHVAAPADASSSRALDAVIVGVVTVAAGISSSGGVALGPHDPRTRPS